MTLYCSKSKIEVGLCGGAVKTKVRSKWNFARRTALSSCSGIAIDASDPLQSDPRVTQIREFVIDDTTLNLHVLISSTVCTQFSVLYPMYTVHTQYTVEYKLQRRYTKRTIVVKQINVEFVNVAHQA